MVQDRHSQNERLAAAFERLPHLLESEPDLIRRGAFFDARFEVGVGDIPFDLIVAAGRIASFARGPFVMVSPLGMQQAGWAGLPQKDRAQSKR